MAGGVPARPSARVTRDTASASEIVAGAIQDHDRGLVVGETSWGKGLVQSVYTLQYGAGLALTTEWQTARCPAHRAKCSRATPPPSPRPLTAGQSTRPTPGGRTRLVGRVGLEPTTQGL